MHVCPARCDYDCYLSPPLPPTCHAPLSQNHPPATLFAAPSHPASAQHKDATSVDPGSTGCDWPEPSTPHLVALHFHPHLPSQYGPLTTPPPNTPCRRHQDEGLGQGSIGCRGIPWGGSGGRQRRRRLVMPHVCVTHSSCAARAGLPHLPSLNTLCTSPLVKSCGWLSTLERCLIQPAAVVSCIPAKWCVRTLIERCTRAAVV